MRLLYLSLMLWSFSSCDKKNNAAVINELTGHYRGTFARTGMDTAEVELFFKTDHSFNGRAGKQNYPAICSGSFLQTGNDLEVNDACTWTANFDWSLIFDGNYSLSFTNENTVRIKRANGDEYVLTRVSQ